MNEMGDKVAVLAAGLGAINLAAPGAGAILTIFLASLAIIGAMVVWISLLIRKALLLIAIVFAPDRPRRIELGPHPLLGEHVGDVRDRDDPVEGRPGRDLPARHRAGLRADRRRPGVGQPADGRRRADAHGRVRAVPDLQGDRLHGLRHVPRDVGRAGGQGVAQPADADPAAPAHRQSSRPRSSAAAAEAAAVRRAAARPRPRHRPAADHRRGAGGGRRGSAVAPPEVRRQRAVQSPPEWSWRRRPPRPARGSAASSLRRRPDRPTPHESAAPVAPSRRRSRTRPSPSPPDRK